MKGEVLTQDDLLGLEKQESTEILASMNFLGLPVVCLSINFTIDALNELAAQVFHAGIDQLKGANFRELCAKKQLDFPIFSQKNEILAGEVVRDFSQWISENAENASELKWAITRHLDQDCQPNGFVVVMTSGFQNMINLPRMVESSYSENSLKVLLIEDDPVCRTMAKSLFEDLFCDVTIADTAKQALECLHDKYDIIFLDIGLPGQDGISFASELRKRLHLSIPILATTGYAWDANRYKEVGINGHIKKPLTKMKLQRALTKFL